jgi:NADPH:quinone reductase-like Zn-dependent oxidoreductase
MSHTKELPSEMRAVVLGEYRLGVEQAIAGLEVAKRPVPRPGKGQVLIRMEAVPVNQSDLLLLQGMYGTRKTLPTIPGWEGAGTVVAAGGGLLARSLTGRKVACAAQPNADGTWAEYHVAPARQCIRLHRGIDLEQGASSIVNPLTALGMLDMIRRGKHRAAVQTAAVSQVGLMMARLCGKHGIPVIHIVRRQEQVQTLQSMGEQYVFDSSTPDFVAKLTDAARTLRATIAFDAVAGAMTGLLLDALPQHSTVVVYGALSAEKCRELDPISIIFRDKRVEPFYVSDWMMSRSFPGMLRIVRMGQSLMLDGTLGTNIARRIPLTDLHDGLTDYVRHFREETAQILLRRDQPVQRGPDGDRRLQRIVLLERAIVHAGVDLLDGHTKDGPHRTRDFVGELVDLTTGSQESEVEVLRLIHGEVEVVLG